MYKAIAKLVITYEYTYKSQPTTLENEIKLAILEKIFLRRIYVNRKLIICDIKLNQIFNAFEESNIK